MASQDSDDVTQLLVTTAGAAILARVAKTTIRSWVRRGRLTPVERHDWGNLYTWADVIDAEQRARGRDKTGRARNRVA